MGTQKDFWGQVRSRSLVSAGITAGFPVKPPDFPGYVPAQCAHSRSKIRRWRPPPPWVLKGITVLPPKFWLFRYVAEGLHGRAWFSSGRTFRSSKLGWQRPTYLTNLVSATFWIGLNGRIDHVEIIQKLSQCEGIKYIEELESM